MDTKEAIGRLRVIADKATVAEEKAAANTAADALVEAYHGDKTFFQIVAGVLGVAVIAVIGVLFLLLNSEHYQGVDGITAIGSAAVAGLVAVFKRT